MEKMNAKIVIVGAGVAGLWVYRALKNAGLQPILFEKDSLGAGQTLASQGMIHGGQRYHLQGTASDHGDKISEMPAIWDKCFSGEGDIDLSGVEILADNQFMWSPGGLISGVATFMASKAMNSRVKALKKEELPEALNIPSFKGKVYRMDECVVEAKTLLKGILGPFDDCVYKAEVKSIKRESPNKILVDFESENVKYTIEADNVIFTAGLGNEIAISDFSLDRIKPQSQRRPLKQIMIKGVEVAFYAHCITTDPRPRVTVTAHPDEDGGYVWYLGGIVAEYGINKSNDEAIAFAKKEIKELFPWMDWSNKEWACVFIDRAEPYFDKNFFKSGPELITEDGLAVAWPTKLTFAPALANQVIKWLKSRKQFNSEPNCEIKFDLPKAEMGQYPWEQVSWNK